MDDLDLGPRFLAHRCSDPRLWGISGPPMWGGGGGQKSLLGGASEPLKALRTGRRHGGWQGSSTSPYSERSDPGGAIATPTHSHALSLLVQVLPTCQGARRRPQATLQPAASTAGGRHQRAPCRGAESHGSNFHLPPRARAPHGAALWVRHATPGWLPTGLPAVLRKSRAVLRRRVAGFRPKEQRAGN